MRHALLLLLVLSMALPASGQKTYPRVEIAGGYSYLVVDRSHRNMPKGWNSSFAINFHRNLGLEAGFGGHYGHFPVLTINDSYYLFQAGPRVAFRLRKLTPWAHALFGVSQSRIAGADATRTNFASALGGGLDVAVHKRLALRMIQADYMRMRVNDFSLAGIGTGGFGLIVGPTPSNNLSLSFGVVIKLGGR